MGARDRSREAVVKTILGEGLNVRLLEITLPTKAVFTARRIKSRSKPEPCTFS